MVKVNVRTVSTALSQLRLIDDVVDNLSYSITLLETS